MEPILAIALGSIALTLSGVFYILKLFVLPARGWRWSWRYWWHEIDDLRQKIGSPSDAEATLIQAYTSQDNSIRVAFISTSVAGLFTIVTALTAGSFALLETRESGVKPAARETESRVVEISALVIVKHWMSSEHYVKEIPSLRATLLDSCPSEMLSDDLILKLNELRFASSLYGCDVTQAEIANCSNATQVVHAATRCRVNTHD